jgi:hypothetical protein
MFGDSVLEDTNAIRTAKLLEFQSGIIEKVQYFVEVYKLTEDLALELVQKMEKRTLDLMGGANAEETDESPQEQPEEPEEEEQEVND